MGLIYDDEADLGIDPTPCGGQAWSGGPIAYLPNGEPIMPSGPFQQWLQQAPNISPNERRNWMAVQRIFLLLNNGNGPDQHKVRVEAGGDPDYLDAHYVAFNSSAQYDSGDDLAVETEVETNQLRNFIVSSAIAGWSAGSNQALYHDTSGTPTWATTLPASIIPGGFASYAGMYKSSDVALASGSGAVHDFSSGTQMPESDSSSTIASDYLTAGTTGVYLVGYSILCRVQSPTSSSTTAESRGTATVVVYDNGDSPIAHTNSGSPELFDLDGVTINRHIANTSLVSLTAGDDIKLHCSTSSANAYWSYAFFWLSLVKAS